MDDGAAEVPEVVEAAPPDLAGTWRLEVTLASTVDLPVVGVARGASVSVLAVTLAPTAEGGWTQRQEVCSVRVKGGGAVVRTSVPEAFLRALRPRAYAATVTEAGGAFRYRADTGVEIVGWDPSMASSLPRAADDPGAADTDGDGAPGATLRLKVAGLGAQRIFVAQRAHTVLEGWVVTRDRIEGRVEVLALEQATLGASHPLLVRDTVLHADERHSAFTMTRTPEGRACDTEAVGDAEAPTPPRGPAPAGG